MIGVPGLVLLGDAAVAAPVFELEAAAARFGELSLERIRVHHRDGTEIEVSGLAHKAFGPLGDVLAKCRADADSDDFDADFDEDSDFR